nr:immunoglobulin heavy chain junction region [Mus musculus]NSM04358.1 immunoglobulin heavy chain junction region [Mus musculus]NSM04505.1 immunoglobulin heavy chain junction region [Mus musculus]NSM04518.1 immunoglobulin heavy chain junction region [Mus musculus]NSM05283.1 immunoglobulin heavy chain junction region [Mus musculus]
CALMVTTLMDYW